MSSIEVEGLTKKFGSFVAVDNLSFKIGKGEVFGLLVVVALIGIFVILDIFVFYLSVRIFKREEMLLKLAK